MSVEIEGNVVDRLVSETIMAVDRANQRNVKDVNNIKNERREKEREREKRKKSTDLFFIPLIDYIEYC